MTTPPASGRRLSHEPKSSPLHLFPERRMKMTRSTHKKRSILVVTFLLTALVATMGCMPLETVEYVDLEQYAGLWYEIARYPTPFDEDTVAVTAEYTLLQDGTVHVLNRGLVGDLGGPETTIEGIARVADPVSQAKLKVSFDRPGLEQLEADYWIIDLAEDYSYAVVSEPLRFILYILSRTPTMDPVLYDGIVQSLTERGFDPDRIELTPQIP
jgi:apolipoprotein D and lipocalin family protein